MSDDHEFEPSYGLPELLPQDERLLWQGSPRWQSIARDLLHLRGLGVYFAVLLVWRGATAWSGGASAAESAMTVAPLLLLAVAALALLTLLAWLMERSSIYTITSKRVVMRIGVVLSVTFNLPYSRIESAGLRLRDDGTGDIALQLAGPDRIAVVHLWPHARPWQIKRTQPMLRSVPEAQRVAGLLSAALAEAAGLSRPAFTTTRADADHGNAQQPLAA